MPVFAQIHSTEAISTVSATCTCPISDDVLMDGILDQSISTLQFQGHVSNCPLHSSQSAVAQLKQQALLKQRQAQRQRKHDPFEPTRLLPTRTCHLYPGSKFAGKQRSGSHSYDVVVDIKHVNLTESTLCGYLHIKGLTEEYPELTTFFDAEIVGPQYSFLTRKWDADESTDEEHWTLFQPFEDIVHSCGRDKSKYDFAKEPCIFMRWKEHFLVPDHRVEGISGASFAGFYYICYNKSSGQINGYYYHHTSEKFQQLILNHVEEKTSFGSYEFR
ncbi:hypothetical protein CPC16_002510 [Podila verticillata]|nr:hypothetical protein BGZ52_003332 [Haplosporangium bisporale]KAF9216620.1 hypothetical protein BGZ59_008886 [Podila verticillata]KAF9393231.1 hypothetical protein CPC16_002510 [Podila verticillata]KAI9239483.1 MAG: vacuolar import and degradation protein-domain-containing protein [Podila humilis]KFH67714.1 hypothetical protein MVEG_06446 [Podila verticillata NRRL 6337]